MWTCNRVAPLLLAGTLVAALLLSGCGPKALKSMKDAHRNGQYSEVATREVSCTDTDDRCNQMHLLKGDACYVLGRQAEQNDRDSTAREHFRCAAHHLGTGIQRTDADSKDWVVAGTARPQWYKNRAESLRQLQDLLAGNEARSVSRDLYEYGQTYQQALPDRAAPYFYVATARYALVQPKLLDASDGDDEVCGALTEITQTLDQAPSGPDIPTAVSTNVEQLARQIDRQRDRLECSS